MKLKKNTRVSLYIMSLYAQAVGSMPIRSG